MEVGTPVYVYPGMAESRWERTVERMAPEVDWILNEQLEERDKKWSADEDNTECKEVGFVQDVQSPSSHPKP